MGGDLLEVVGLQEEIRRITNSWIFTYYATNYNYNNNFGNCCILNLCYFGFIFVGLMSIVAIHRSYVIFFFFNKTFNIRLISVSSAESTFCVGTDVKRFSCVGMRVTDLSRLHCAAQTALDRLFAAREISNISGSYKTSGESFRELTQAVRKHIVRKKQIKEWEK